MYYFQIILVHFVIVGAFKVISICYVYMVKYYVTWLCGMVWWLEGTMVILRHHRNQHN